MVQVGSSAIASGFDDKLDLTISLRLRFTRILSSHKTVILHFIGCCRMFDRKNHAQQFRVAVRNFGSNNDYGNSTQKLALLFRISPVPSSRSTYESKSSNEVESCQGENGMDWTSVLNAWLDVCEAAEKVIIAECLRRLGSFLNLILHVSRLLQQGQAVQCYESQATLHACFNQLYASSVGNTLVPALIEVCKSTHRLAVAADLEIASRDHAKLNAAALLLQESYSKSYSDRKELIPGAPYDDDGSKKVAVLFIVNELFKIYFRLNTLRLCKNVAKPTEAKKLHEQGTMAQMVTYKYFSGRLCLFEDNFVDAEKNLEYAFLNCPNDAIHNKRCILRYLIPVKLYRGKLPTPMCKIARASAVALIWVFLTFPFNNYSIRTISAERVYVTGGWYPERRPSYI
jgi:hypothetical protein